MLENALHSFISVLEVVCCMAVVEAVYERMTMSADNLVMELSPPRTRNVVVVEFPDYDKPENTSYAWTDDSDPANISYPSAPHFIPQDERNARMQLMVDKRNLITETDYCFGRNYVILTPVVNVPNPFNMEAVNHDLAFTVRYKMFPEDDVYPVLNSDGNLLLGCGMAIDDVISLKRFRRDVPDYAHKGEKGDPKKDGITTFVSASIEALKPERPVENLRLWTRNYAIVFPSQKLYDAWKGGRIASPRHERYPIVLDSSDVKNVLNGKVRVAVPDVPKIESGEKPVVVVDSSPVKTAVDYTLPIDDMTVTPNAQAPAEVTQSQGLFERWGSLFRRKGNP